MENASKALYMAAGVLIGMMILGVFVYLFRAGGEVGQNYEQKQSQEQLQLFNSKFEYFDKNNNTIMDMISVTNLAISNNEENEFNSQKTVEIDIMLRSEILSVNATESIERNYLFRGATDEKVYVYDLIDKNRVYLRNEAGLNLNVLLGNDTDTLSTVNEKMVYKYLFKCSKIEYHKSTGRVKYMKFVTVKNSEY